MPKTKGLLGNQVVYDGHVFTRDKNTGYYLSAKPICNGKRIRLHRYVWITTYGEIPPGFDVHHKDEDKGNNGPDNLNLMTNPNHMKHHMEIIMTDHVEERREKFLKHAHPAAAEWHRSEEGREWHTGHWHDYLEPKFHEIVKKNCVVCGTEYDVSVIFEYKSMFCSKKCKAKYRRDSGVDDITRDCVICGTPFTGNRYDKKVACSRKCAGIIASAKRLGRGVPVYGKSSQS